MAERMTSLSIATLFDGDHNHPGIPAFITGFAEALHSGSGRKPQLLEVMGVDVEFPVRLLLGVPKKDLTRQQRLIAEAYCSMFFGRNLGDTAGLWTSGKGWRPQNPDRVPAPIQESTLDVKWMLSLGIGRTTWDKSILFSDAALARAEGGQIAATTSIRHLLALTAFGFSEPHQFFTATQAR